MSDSDLIPDRHRFTDKQGRKFVARPVCVEDREALEAMFRSCSSETLYTRFLSPGLGVPLRYLDRLMFHKPPGIITIVAEEEEGGDGLVALMNFVATEGANHGEIAIVVQDGYQNGGVGTMMIRYLLDLARKLSIEKFIADIDAGNRRVFHMIQRAGYSSRITIDQGVAHVEMDLRCKKESQGGAKQGTPA